MMRTISTLLCALVTSAALAEEASITLARVGTIDARFQSYNIEMVEVTGGRFWRPYSAADAPGEKPDLFANRAPINLADTRLRKLAAALAPASWSTML